MTTAVTELKELDQLLEELAHQFGQPIHSSGCSRKNASATNNYSVYKISSAFHTKFSVWSAKQYLKFVFCTPTALP
jgi:hypothetical protein